MCVRLRIFEEQSVYSFSGLLQNCWLEIVKAGLEIHFSVHYQCIDNGGWTYRCWQEYTLQDITELCSEDGQAALPSGHRCWPGILY